jgi:hypothetical protein
MSLPKINEGSTAWLEVAFLDRDGLPETPVGVTYRIDCLTNDSEVTADSSLSPGSSVEVVLSAADNQMIDETKETEHRRVTVTATYGAGQAHIERFDYLVQNLRAV